jgi:hypothetical protein
MSEFAEANTTEIKVSHIATLTRTQLASSYDLASILRFAHRAQNY